MFVLWVTDPQIHLPDTAFEVNLLDVYPGLRDFLRSDWLLVVLVEDLVRPKRRRMGMPQRDNVADPFQRESGFRSSLLQDTHTHTRA